ncbi:MAG: molybdopterin-dependent oxidoreductase [Candidatus Methanofastidiosia archaeon]
MKELELVESIMDSKFSRRTFLKVAGTLGAMVSGFRFLIPVSAQKETLSHPGADPLKGVMIKRSTCLMCHSGCGIQCTIKDGVLIKIDGNPYDPKTLEPHLSFDTDPREADKIRGTVCAKGQAGIQELYNPLRVKGPLKRAGPRGSGEWKAISWDEALTEIVEGGSLPGGREGEPEYQFEGLRSLRDLETPIDPNAPELGPRANGVVYSVGRSEHGRKEFTDRFWGSAFGTINKRIDHTSICEASHHVAYDIIGNKGGPGGKGLKHAKPDIVDSEYIIFFGSSPLEANFPMQTLARKLMMFKEKGGKLVIVDPRFSNSAAKADTWISIKMGTDAAFALGMMRWMIENKKYDAKYLENTTEKAANVDGHKTWTNATYLVRMDDMTHLRAKDAGIEGGTEEQFVVISNGNPKAHDAVEHGELEVDLTVNGIFCKSAFTLLKERVRERTISEYAGICGINAGVIEKVAKEFTYHKRKACADFYRGPVQHTNGTYTGMAIGMLNWLIGNMNVVGGMSSGGGHWHEMGGKSGNLYDLGKLHPGKVKSKGVVLTRYKAKYEDTTEFEKNGYPAKRPWFPLALHGNWQEIVPSIAQGYPYSVKALINHMGNTVYSTPGGIHFVETLKDTKKLPLIISFTTVMSEIDALSDYILPDRHYLERYSTTHTAPAILSKVSQFRVPVVDPVFKDTRLEEDVLIEIAKRMGLSGFGEDGFGEGMPLNNAWDWYKKMFSNIASEGDGVPGLTEEDRLNYCLSRGGRFEDYGKRHDWKGICLIYVEKLAKTKDSMSGKPYDGLPRYEPIKDCIGNEVKDEGYDFELTTYKPVFHTQSRTASNPWLMELQEENYVEINSQDAEKLGVKTGDLVKVTSPSNEEGVVGKALVTEGMRPGVIAISHSYGHWEYGSKPYKVDGKESEYAEFIGKGVSGNPVMRLDPVLKDVPLQDPIGGSASFYDTKVRVERVV